MTDPIEAAPVESSSPCLSPGIPGAAPSSVNLGDVPDAGIRAAVPAKLIAKAQRKPGKWFKIPFGYMLQVQPNGNVKWDIHNNI